MNESEYLSIPECYMKEIPKDVWYSWPIEIRKEFFQMISDPNFFFYNSRPFNEEIYDENIVLSDYEKKEFWKRVDYFFSNLGITNLRNLDNLWGYLAIPFKHRTGDFLKNYFYLPENKSKINSTLSYYNISSNSTQSPLVKIQLIKKEAQIFILSFIHDYIYSISQEPHIANLPLNSANYADQIKQNFIANRSIANENLIDPKNTADDQDTDLSYTINFPPTDLSVGFRSNIKNNFKSFFDSNRQNLNDRNQIQPLKILVNQIQKTITNEERMAIATEKRSRGRPRKHPIQDSPSSQAFKNQDKINKSSENEYIENDQNSEDLPSSDENNETDTAGYEDNNEISDHIESKSQTPINSQQSDDDSNSENNDEEIKNSNASLKDFIASDNSYDYITEDQDDDDEDDDDGEYQEISSRYRNYNSTKGKRKRNTKKQSNNLKLESIKQMNSNNLINDGGNNFFNHQRFNQYNNNAFNPYNNEANFNQIYNNGRYPNLSIINANPLPQNQQQFYKFNNNPHFIQEEVKFGIHPPVNPSQIGYQPIFQITPQTMPSNQFNAIQAANGVKIAPLAPINQPNIQILQGPIQPLMPAQIRPIQPANIPINNYPNIIVSGNLSSTFPQIEKKAQLVKMNINQPPSIPIKPLPDSSFKLQPNKNATQYHLPKADENPLPKDNMLTPKRAPESSISNSNFKQNTKNSVPNSGNNYQFIYPSYNNSNLTHQQKSQVPNSHPISIQSQTKNQQQPKQSFQPQNQQTHSKPPSNYQPQPSNNISKKQISNKHEYDDEYDYEKNQYNSYSDGNKTDDENYSSNNEAAQQTSESAIESEHQNFAEAASENSDFYDKKIDNDNKINPKEFNQDDTNSKLHTKKFILRTRNKLTKGNQFSSDDDYEPDEMIGIVSHLSYLYDENSSKNEYSRISKVKPSDLIDLEFVEH